MTHQEIRKKFLEFFERKGHKIVPSSSLVPDDPSVLFTTAGMQQFKSYYTNPENAPAKNIASIQKCMRTSDIDEVGDESHLTFFEMLGNFSFGGYGKEEAIKYAYEFITKKMGLKVDYVSVFDGEEGIPADNDSKQIWEAIDPSLEIRECGRKDNFWGPTGDEGPCGPTTEIYVNGVEIWNIVFNEYYCNKDKSLKKLGILGVDTGMGLERLAMAVQKKNNIFEADLFTNIISFVRFPAVMEARVKRIMLDHGRAVAFLIADGVHPSNKEQGYVLRRLIRRMMAHFYRTSGGSYSGSDILGMDFFDIEVLLKGVVRAYNDFYNNLDEAIILSVFREENEKFRRAIQNGIRKLKKIDTLDTVNAFHLFESYGLTFEIIKDFSGDKAKNLKREDFDKEFKKHQKKSRAGAEKKFGIHKL